MKYNFTITPMPSISCNSSLRSQQEIIADIVETKNVYVTVDLASKTILSVTIGSYYAELNVSYIPKGCENLKFHEKYMYNYWSSEGAYRYMFKILKNQKWNEFIHYVKCLIESLGIPELDELNVQITISQEAKDKLEAPDYN